MIPEDIASMKISVHCYAGYRGEEKPIRFVLGTRSYEVRAVQDQWYGECDRYFRVLADDGHLYVLRYRESDDEWHLESFRRGDRASPLDFPPSEADKES